MKALCAVLILIVSFVAVFVFFRGGDLGNPPKPKEVSAEITQRLNPPVLIGQSPTQIDESLLAQMTADEIDILKLAHDHNFTFLQLTWVPVRKAWLAQLPETACRAAYFDLIKFAEAYQTAISDPLNVALQDKSDEALFSYQEKKARCAEQDFKQAHIS
jgi:hypothetical protein